MTKYVYICSAGHSGSTLLDILVGAHPMALSLGELFQLPKNISLRSTCSCGSEISKCELWSKVIDEVASKRGIDLWSFPYKMEFGFHRGRNLADNEHQTRRLLLSRQIARAKWYLQLTYRGRERIPPTLKSIAENTAQVYDAAIKASGASVTIDSSKDYIRGAALYLAYPADTKILLLTRDGRGVTYSHIRRNQTALRSALGWKNYYSRAMRVLGHNVPSQSIMWVKYEDMVRSPEQTIARVHEFVGLPVNSPLGNNSKRIHILNGNAIRFDGHQVIKPDEQWRENLSKHSLAVFRMTAGRMNRRLGYGDAGAC